MSRNPTLRTLAPALACAAALALGAPAAASPQQGPAQLWHWLAGLPGLSFLTGEVGAGQDPDGATAPSADLGEAGAIQDPNGAASASTDFGEEGAIQDPNG
jgi:hypothetical protein